MSNAIVDLIKESVIVQGLLTLMVVGAWLYLLIVGLPVPDALNQVVGLVIGFYFGGKVYQQARKLQQEGC